MVLAGYNCVSCIIDDVVGALLPLVSDDKLREKVIKACLIYLAEEFSTDQVPSVFITRVHRILKETTGITVPYEFLRRRCNEIGMEIANDLKKELINQDEFTRFSTLIRWVIAGNELDFRTVGTGYDIKVSEIRNRLEACVQAPLAVDDVEQIFQLVHESSRILYIPDNVGEIAFDLLLIKELKSFGNLVYMPLRGGPITSDATLDDGTFVGAAGVATEIFRSGKDTLGILLHEASERMKKELQLADLIICKGQANFYTFSEYKNQFSGNVVSLLRTKCDWVAKYFGTNGKVNIAAILKQ